MQQVAEILKRVRRLQIVANRTVDDLFAGQYKSVFRGRVSVPGLIQSGFALTGGPLSDHLTLRGLSDMVSHMKTTINIADSLFLASKRLAARRGVTFREIVESALRRAVEEGELQEGEPFKLRKHSFRGNGLREGLTEGDWAAVREAAYEGRGG